MQIKISNFCLIILLTLFSLELKSQVNETFSGINFNETGIWAGDINNFTKNNLSQGQLNAPGAGTSYFSTPLSWEDSYEFSFWVKMNFAPSKSNRLGIYLQNENSDLNTGNGLFLSIGEDGSNDGVKLNYGSLTSSIPIAEAGNGQFADIVEGWFKGSVTQGHLKIDFQKTDLSIINIYDGARPDEFILGQPTHFGFWMTYTVTRKEEFYFDDIIIKKIEADTKGPVVENVLATSLNTLVLNFDEAVENSGLINKSNYEIRNASNELLTIQSINVQGQSITITTSEALNVNPNTIKISNLQDLLGNIMVPQSIEFSYTIAETAGQFDILINELLPDPSPVIGLPNSEFIELYNSSDKTFKLSDYKLQKSTTLYPLPNVNFLPGTYLIIVPNSDLALWSAYSNVFGLSSFPSLNNEGTTISLINGAQNLIHSVTYDLNSYKDAIKKDGGWSLEHTLKEGVCDGLDVFRASTDVSGGTPGRANTNATISENALRVINVVLSSNQSIEVCLSKTVDFSDPSNGLAFQGVNTPGFTILYSTPITACFQIQFDEPLVDGTWYKINIGPQITNCIGKKIAIDTTIGFGQGFATPEVGEVIVNEILFNPPTGGFDFVEFYNKSDKIFDLNGLIIANTLGNKTSLINKTTFIQPGEYLVFCQDPTWLKNNYNVKFPNSIQQMLIPSFNDDEGNVTLWNGDIMIDSFRYNAKMHSVFLKDDEGISLERISEDVLSTLNSNWQSAATDVGGATPTYKNSQSRTIKVSDKILSKEEDHFSPNQDGYLDQFIVQYHLDKPGYVLRWRVFDAQGRPIKTDNTGVLTGADGFVTWDGSTDDNIRALPGIFIIEFQFSHNDGSSKKEKISCVLTYPK